MGQCKHCKRNVPDNLIICNWCGGVLAPTLACQKCGRQILAHLKTCQYCGTAVATAKAPAAEVQPCPKCGRNVALHLERCQMCGTAMPQAARATAGGAAPAAATGTFASCAQLLATASPQKQALVWSMLACTHNNERRFEQALSCFDKALQLDPRCSAAFASKMSCLVNMQRGDEALAAVAAVLARNPGNPGVLQMQQQLTQHKQNGAFSGLAIWREPHEEAEALKAKASALDDQNRLPEALATYEQSLRLDPTFTNAWCDRGYVLKKMGRLDEALECYRFCVQLNALDALPWNNLGNTLVVRQQYREAIECFDRALALDPKMANAQHMRQVAAEKLANPSAGAAILSAQSPDAPEVVQLLAQAANFKQQSKFDEALQYYDQALALEPRSHVIWYNKANTYYAMSRYADALSCYDKALEIEPKDKKVWFNKAASLEELGRITEALACFNKCVALDPQYANALNAVARLEQAGAEAPPPPVPAPAAKPADSAGANELFKQAMALYHQKQIDAAIACLRKTTELNAGHKDAWNNLGALLNDKHQPAEALRCAERSLQLDPRYLNAYATKASALEGLKRYDEAVTCYDQALALKADSVLLWGNKATCLLNAGRFEEAVQSFDRALALDPRDGFALGNKGAALARLGRHQEALACYAQRVQLEPQNASAWYNRGCALGKLKRHAEAVRDYDQALKLRPQYKEALNNKGECLSHLGQLDAALAVYDQALQLAPRFAHAFCGKAECMRKLGRPAEALNLAQKALENAPEDSCAWHEKALAEHALRSPQAASSLQKYIALASTDDERLSAARELCAKLTGGTVSTAAPSSSEPVSQEVLKKLFSDAEALGKAKKFQEAIAAYDRLLALAPNVGGFYLNKGIYLEELKRQPEALECYKKAVALSPQEPNFVAQMGICLGRMGRYDEALAALDKSLQLNPAAEVAWRNKAYALKCMNRREEACRCYAKILELNPNNFNATIDLAILYYELERYDEALRIADTGLKLRNTIVPLWQVKGAALTRLKRFAEALPALEQSLNLDERQILSNKQDETWVDKGLCLSALGRTDEANACFDKAIAVTPMSARGFLYKALADERRGQPQNVAEYFFRAVELFNAWVRVRPAEDYIREERELACRRLKELDPTRAAASEADHQQRLASRTTRKMRKGFD